MNERRSYRNRRDDSVLVDRVACQVPVRARRPLLLMGEGWFSGAWRIIIAFSIGSCRMTEGNPGAGRSGQTLIFTSGNRLVGSAAFFCTMIAAIAFIADSSNAWSRPTNVAAVLGCLIIAWIIGLTASRQWTAEIDIAARSLKISRRSFGRWTKAIVDCPLDECNAFGTIEYRTDGHISYGAYVQLKDGARHAIPLKESTFSEAVRVASRLSAATGIPRLDTIF